MPMKSGRTLATIFGLTMAALSAITVWARRQRGDPSACPYSQRFFLDLPRPFMRRETLRRLLAPMPGERVLEIGPGLGYYSLDIAPRLAPGGQLDVLDLQQPMLDELMRRAAASNLTNIVPAQGDAQELPYADGSFDAAFLVATLGEIPDKDRALHELRRVLKPGGRLVVGEGQPDPHMVSRDDLLIRAHKAGLLFEEQVGGALGYLAAFRAA
jgi:SAM-dependent methyltransferase